MKRVKTLAAILMGVALLASLAPAMAQSAAYRHYVACGLSENAKPAHVCQKGRDKGAFFRSTTNDVFYTVCVKFPTKRRLCAPKQEAKAGTLYVNKITSNIPGQHKVTWFVEGKRVGSVRLQREGVAGPLAILGFDTATEDTAVAAVRGDEVRYESLLGLSEKGSPMHTTALLGEVERAVEAAGGWDEIDAIAVGVGPGSFTGLRVGIATARALGLSRGLRVRGVGTLDALGRGLDGRGDGIRVAVLDARRGEVFAASYAPEGERIWDPFVCEPQELAERIAGDRRAARFAPDRARYDFARSWRAPTSRFQRTPIPPTGSPPGTSAPWRRPGLEQRPSPPPPTI